MTAVAKGLAGVVALLLVLTAWFAWRDHRGGQEREAALRALSAAQANLDAGVRELARASAAVASRVDTVRITTNHWRTVSSQPSPVPPRADTTSNVDSLRSFVTRLMQRNLQLVTTGDSLERSCTALANDCDALRVRADSVPDLVRQLREKTETAVQAEKPRRRWSPLGCSAGAAAVQSAGQVRAGFGAACGVTYSL